MREGKGLGATWCPPQEDCWVCKFHGMTLKISRVFEGEGRKNNLEKAIESKKDISSRPLSIGDVIFKKKQLKISSRKKQLKDIREFADLRLNFSGCSGRAWSGEHGLESWVCLVVQEECE